jgi:hypothetical protein
LSIVPALYIEVVPPYGRKRGLAATKLIILDTMFGAFGIAVKGYPNPKSAKKANTKNIPAKEKSVYLDNLMVDEKKSIE